MATLMAGYASARQAAPPAAPSTAPSLVPPPAEPVPPALAALHRDIAALLDGPGLQRATWGIAVQSLRTGERLFEHNPRTLLVPGSVMKVVTAAVAGAASGSAAHRARRELEILHRITRATRRPTRVAVRVNPDFELKSAGMKMGSGPKQFGIDAEIVPEILEEIGRLGLGLCCRGGRRSANLRCAPKPR